MWVVREFLRLWSGCNDLLLSNLVLANGVISVFTIPLLLLSQIWDLPCAFTSVFRFLQASSVLVSVFAFSSVAVERICDITNPFGDLYNSKVKPGFVILLTWLEATITVFPTHLNYSVRHFPNIYRILITPYGNPTSQHYTFKWYYSQYQMVGKSLLSIIIATATFITITGVYIRVGIKLWKRRILGNKRETRSLYISKKKRRAST